MALFALLIAGSFSIGDRAAPYVAPVPFNAVRFLIAVFIMGVAAYAMTGRTLAPLMSISRETVIHCAILGGLMAVYFVTMFISLRLSDPVSTSAVFTLVPLMSAAFGLAFLAQRTKIAALGGLLLAGAGAVWVIFRGDAAALLAFQVGRGEVIYFFGCLAHAAYAPLVAKFNRSAPVIVFTFWTLTATMTWLLIFSAPTILTVDWLSMPSIVWLAIAYLAIFTTAGTFFLLQFAVLRLPSGKAFAYSYLTPAFVISLEAIFAGEIASASVIIGAFVIVVGLVMLMRTSDV